MRPRRVSNALPAWAWRVNVTSSPFPCRWISIHRPGGSPARRSSRSGPATLAPALAHAAATSRTRASARVTRRIAPASRWAARRLRLRRVAALRDRGRPGPLDVLERALADVQERELGQAEERALQARHRQVAAVD